MNQPAFVKSSMCQKLPERRERLNFRGNPIDPIPAKSSAGYLPAWAKARDMTARAHTEDQLVGWSAVGLFAELGWIMAPVVCLQAWN
jgi:hypothetical protein